LGVMKKKFLGIVVIVSLFLGIGMIFVPTVVAQTLDLSMVQPGDILLGRNPNAGQTAITYYTHAALVIDRNVTIEIRGNGYTVDVYPITDWAGWFKNKAFTRVAILRVNNASSYHKEAAINKAKEAWGKPYWWIYPLSKFPNPQYHYCSSLVWHAYRWGVAIDLDYNGGSYVLPDDIALDNDIKYISVQGQ
ncbi:MAG: YiiX/YebB-like N1pC/P60 family cysteine hydrolase, partial [bacterium]